MVEQAAPVSTDATAIDLYLDLMANCLTRLAFPERYRSIHRPQAVWKCAVWNVAYRPVTGLLGMAGLELVKKQNMDPLRRTWGQDWPEEAETMIGLKRLQNIRYCVSRVIEDRVPGDLIETGVWRGGAAIFMRAILKAHGDNSRIVWLADSFQGLPKPDEERYPADKDSPFWRHNDRLAISVDQVKQNFQRYGLLDDSVRFLVGWFRDTLPTAPVAKLAVLRLDGDMYESTMDALSSLYDKVSPGGFIIVDDYELTECRRAITDFREGRGIADQIIPIDASAVFWRKSE